MFFISQISWAQTSTPSAPTTEQEKYNHSQILRLLENSADLSRVQMRIDQGVVILEGQITDQAKLDWLISKIEKLPAIIAVVNKTTLITSRVTDLSPLQEEIHLWLNQVKKAVPRIFISLTALLVFYFLSIFLHRLSYRLWSYKIANAFLLSTVAKFSLLPFYLMMFYMLLLMMGLRNLAMTIIGGTGVLGIILGLSFKGILENFFSGILLAMRSPFTKGDLIQVDDIKGVVQNLNMRGTTVMDPDGTLILIPNTTVVQSIVQNISTHPQTRTSFTIPLSLESSISEAQRILMNVLNNIARVLQDPPPLVLVDDLKNGSVDLKVYFWFDIRKSSLVGSRSRVMAACKEALASAGINIRDPQKEIIIRSHAHVHGDAHSHNEAPAPVKISDVEKTHDKMMQGTSPEESIRQMAQRASLPGNSQTPNLLKK